MCRALGVTGPHLPSGDREAMIRLQIHKFGCLEEADLTVSQLTVVIGPQASGKSVVAKLLHFFNEIITRTIDGAQREDRKTFLRGVEDRFVEQFPATAWGGRRFTIQFEAGLFAFEIARNRSERFRVTITANDHFNLYYDRLSADFTQIKATLTDTEAHRIAAFDKLWPIREREEDALSREMGADYVRYQIFVPAGRSFFTTLGKTAVALGSSVVTDSITQRFGRFITSMRDDTFAMPEDVLNPVQAAEILGGRVVKEGDREFLKSDDGRTIPLSLMSSGQQEFYPLQVALGYASYLSSHGSTIFIEEPEAHLFPSAQSKLIDLLVDTLGGAPLSRKMFITTHSPYCLSKLNNLLRAGALAQQRPDLIDEISNVVERQRWLTTDSLSAYAIDNGVLKPLLDEDGLIDTNYIDSISSELADQFGALIDLEFAG